MSTSNKTPALFTPLTLRGLTLKNRIVMGPMCMYSAVDGLPTPWHLQHYATRASGGVGLVMVEATGVVPEGRISNGCTGMWSDEHANQFLKITELVHAIGAKIGIQLGHAGRKASCEVMAKGGKALFTSKNDAGAWDIVAPSAVAFSPDSPVPKELSKEEITQLVKSFGEAAARAVNIAKFDTIEIHGAHGYLLHQFYSPISNKRNDEYGAQSFENRTRLLREIVQEVRSKIPNDMPLLVRLSCEDWIEGGVTLQETVQLSKDLKSLGVDLIDCSGGGIAHNEFPKGYVTPMYMVASAELVQKESGIPTAAVGGIKTSKDANEIIESGKASLTMIASHHMYDPYFAHRAATELGIEKSNADALWPAQYGWARRYLK